MNSPRHRVPFRSDFSRSARLVLVVAIVLLAGCSSHLSTKQVNGRMAALPGPTLVAHGAALAAAQRVAAQRPGDFVLCGVGQSMMPRYVAGTVVVVHPAPYFMLRPGMPVVYRNRRGAEVAHVLVEENDQGWLAQGLNNAAPDDELVTAGNLVGVITYAFVADDAPFRGDVARQLAMESASQTGARISLLH